MMNIEEAITHLVSLRKSDMLTFDPELREACDLGIGALTLRILKEEKMEAVEKLRELQFVIDNKLKDIRDAGWVACDTNKSVPEVHETRDQILNLVKEAGWIDPVTCIMPGEFGTPKAKEILAQWAEQAGYLPVEPVQLEVLGDEEIHKRFLIIEDPFIPRYLDTGRQTSQATNTHNEAKGQLYRRIKNGSTQD